MKFTADPMKTALALLAAVTIAWPLGGALAAKLPAVEQSASERAMTAEEALSAAEGERAALAAEVNVARLSDHRRNRSVRLTAAERRSVKRFDEMEAKIGFWKDVVELKTALASLHGGSPPAGATAEADAIARSLVGKTYELTREWGIGGSALIHNALINSGKKKKGFCYHFAAELKKTVAALKPSWFEPRWGSAWEGTFRESNALVVVARGAPFEAGIAFDPWRTAGRPFWTPVKGDRFPWVEGFDVEKNYEVE